MKTRKFKLKGGPWDGHKGGFVDKGQMMTSFKGFFYHRAPIQRPGTPVQFVYNDELTETSLRSKGIDPTTGAIGKQGSAESFKAGFNADLDRWELHRGGELVDTRPSDAVTTGHELKEWAAEYLAPNERLK